jgi:putative ATPase
MRPRSLDEVEGPEEVLGSNGFLRRSIAEDRVPSLVLWGPPGVGKTTLARLVAAQTSSNFVSYSAVATGVKEMREVLESARRTRSRGGKRTILFIDEIHRFNRAQQDVFLPVIESGEVVLIGATTENPSFELNGALLSRCKVVVLDPLTPEAIARIVRRALRDIPRGLGARDFRLDDEALTFIAQTSGGDARRALNLLEAAAADAEAGKTKRIEVSRLRELFQRKVLLYDKAGEEHYNLISALHKSMRESDPDATVYWLVRMLEAGPTARVGCALRLKDVVWRSRAHGRAPMRKSPELGSGRASLAASGSCSLRSQYLYIAEARRRRTAGSFAESVPRQRETPGPDARIDMDRLPVRTPAQRGHECLPESLRGRRYYRPRHSGEEAELARRLETILKRRQEKWMKEEKDKDREKEEKDKKVGSP